MSKPLIAVEPAGAPAWLEDAVIAGGGVPSAPEKAAGLVWYSYDSDALAQTLAASPHIRWVQLRSAGIERYRPILDDRRLWTSAKGIYGEAVAEHALAMILAWYREIPRLARSHTWTEPSGSTLYDAQVTLVGAGGISRALIQLLKPFRVTPTVVRRRPEPVDGAARTVPHERMMEAIANADVVVLACALVEDTLGLFGHLEFESMPRRSLLVNVGRGRLVRTNELVAALTSGTISGAALDVVDPEPLPADHPLWSLDNVLITPHSANTDALGRGPLAHLISENVRRFGSNSELLSQVNVQLGY